MKVDTIIERQETQTKLGSSRTGRVDLYTKLVSSTLLRSRKGHVLFVLFNRSMCMGIYVPADIGVDLQALFITCL